MEIYTARSRYRQEGVTWVWYRNDEEEIHTDLQLSEVFRLIRRELDKFVDEGILTKNKPLISQMIGSLMTSLWKD